MPPARLGTRVKTSPWLRRLVPPALVLKIATRRAEAKWEQNRAAREDAIAAMETIVARTPRAPELNELGRSHLIEDVTSHALFWQPWPTLKLDPPSEARLRDVLRPDRGLLLSFCHVGPFHRATSAFVSRGRVPYSVVGPWFFAKPTRDYAGRHLARWRKGIDSRLVHSERSFSILQALLERGEVVLVAFDRPGPHETRFLGKTAMLADGSSRLAVQTKTLVLPIRTRRVGHVGWMDVAEPLDPRDFESVDELHDCLAALHEDWILERPEAMQDPRSFGWGEWATADSWNRPRSAGRPA